MPSCLRVGIIDLLAEYSSFGHLGNLEVLKSYECEVEALLFTPQYQNNLTLNNSKVTTFEKKHLEGWNGDRDFRGEEKIDNITLKRVLMPISKEKQFSDWFEDANLSAIVCSGSKSNLSMPEEWHEHLLDFVRAGIEYSIPYLGICFGHQVLCKAYGGIIERANEKSEGTWPIKLTDDDEIFNGIGENPDAIFTHQEHVTELPKTSFLKKIATAKHTTFASVRMFDKEGGKLPVWGVQFHPESSTKVIQKSVEDGHEKSSRAKIFKENHIGSVILKNFALLSSSGIVESSTNCI